MKETHLPNDEQAGKTQEELAEALFILEELITQGSVDMDMLVKVYNVAKQRKPFPEDRTHQ